MAVIAGLGAALLATGLLAAHRQFARIDVVAEVLGGAVLLVAIGSALLYVALSQ
jgi:hypothetical protein